ncbi:MAG: hypothetical protein V4629_11730 [Pseudomonadota bacterium]
MYKYFLLRFTVLFLSLSYISSVYADIGHAEATRRVQSMYPGTVLSVDQANKKDGYRVKFITPDHQIRVLWVDSESGNVGGYGGQSGNNLNQKDFFETNRPYQNNQQTESLRNRHYEYRNR